MYATVAERTGSVSKVGRGAGPARPAGSARPAPIRLTRRGRMAVTAAVVLVTAAVSMVAAGEAQATSHPGRAGRGNLVRLMVQPGQSLWSIAESSEPDADTRAVVEQIRQLNSLAGYGIMPGEVLWVPRG